MRQILVTVSDSKDDCACRSSAASVKEAEELAEASDNVYRSGHNATVRAIKIRAPIASQ